ncbi:MAG: hypothetical protein COA78_16800 [Blastopirellula sp.]|nr:MAG: hypothetical protein COA78_16800 [Blastopirellula sp.]
MSFLQEKIRTLSRVVDQVNLVAQFICYRLLEIIVIVIVLQVVLRFVFNSPTKWSEEAAMISLVWFGMLAVAIGVRRHRHIAITFFRDLLPPRGGLVLDIFAQLMILAFALILITNGSELMAIAGKTRLPASQIPKIYLYLSAMTGGLLMAINAITNLLAGPLNDNQNTESETNS